MKFTVEQANPDQHYEALARFLNHFEPDPIAAADIREWDRRSEGHIVRRGIVRDTGPNQTGEVIGYGVVHHGPWNQPDEFYLWVGVAVEKRRQGVGQQLYDDAITFIQSLDGNALTSEIAEDQVDGLRFARRQGFTQHKHTFQSKLDLHNLDLHNLDLRDLDLRDLDLHGLDAHAFTDGIDALQASGIRFFTVADLGETEAARRELYAINRRVTLDDPGSEGIFPSFEQFCKDVFAAPWYRPQGQWLAADGDHIIGMCAVGYFQESNSMYNMMTGVDNGYRGRGIAQALKVLAIRWAKAYGADYIRTNNNSENAPMLAINRKLGYEPQPGSYQFTKTL